jgi:hypothetical protein
MAEPGSANLFGLVFVVLVWLEFFVRREIFSPSPLPSRNVGPPPRGRGGKGADLREFQILSTTLNPQFKMLSSTLNPQFQMLSSTLNSLFQNLSSIRSFKS